jgi:hypothetical protein
MKTFSKRFFLIGTIILFSAKGLFALFSPHFEMMMDNKNYRNQFLFYTSSFNKGKIFYNPFFQNLLLPPNSNSYFVFPSALSPQYSEISVRMNYNAPTLPFFCALECKNQQRFNIWIKFRAGTDDDYEKMIGSRKPFRY